ncbi:M15 family metallopeptidase [Dactylosporangium sp. CA-092794]|uniref:M15 family metallopeptidase n=1 Tax=Dactylosporangium sp. CA-092794 TaxID=3239929 RepID=UPI003D9199FF
MRLRFVSCLVMAGALVASCAHAAPAPPVSAAAPPPSSPAPSSAPAPSLPSPRPAEAALPQGFVGLSDVDGSILSDMRYATPHNFVGRVVNGYVRPRCIVTRQAAEALHRVQQSALARGFSLKMYDCYRPQRAVDDFVSWSHDADQRMKGEFYPRVAKSELFDDGYIGGPTAHSRGSTVDLTIAALPARAERAYAPGEPLVSCTAPADRRFPDDSADMGTGFDCFDPLAHTAADGITQAEAANRALLKDLMAAQGFTNYPKEWWHYTLSQEPFPDTYFDFPVA